MDSVDHAGMNPKIAFADATRALIRAGLAEDFADGPDATATATLDPDAHLDAEFVVRREGVIAGLDVIAWTMAEVNADIEVELTAEDGDWVGPGTRVARVRGRAVDIVGGERTALNLLTYASGIATRTRQFVDAVDGTGVRIRDSRKTLPGYRALAKYAVRAGGGMNHRMSLGDMALIKDNHVAAVGSVAEAYRRVRETYPDLPVETEVDDLGQLADVLEFQPDLVMLDNFSVADTRRAVAMRNERSPHTKLESSGGLTLDVARSYAETGVDMLAVGELTHSVRVLDIGLDA